jgi:hypothetical protein
MRWTSKRVIFFIFYCWNVEVQSHGGGRAWSCWT